MQILVQKAHAVTGLGDLLASSGSSSLANIKTFLTNTQNWALDVVGMLAVIMILYGAFIYVTAYGDDTKAGTAKKTILYALLGLVLVALAATIVSAGKGLLNGN